MKTLTATVVTTLLAAALLAACGSRSGEPQPPEMAYGQDMCEACGMLIDDPHFAAASITTDGRAHKFDDLGEMIMYHKSNAADVRAWFVHDYDSEAWIRAETAVFVRSPKIMAPMGAGLAAFGERSAAEALAADVSGEVLAWDELQAMP